MPDNEFPEKTDPKMVLSASVGVGANAYRLAILAQVFVYPFFVYHFYLGSFNIFSTWKTFEYFLFATIWPTAGTIIINAQNSFIGSKRKLKWYDPPMSIFLLPWAMALGEHFQEVHMPLRQVEYFAYNMPFLLQYIHCIAWWGLFVSPFWILYWVGKRTAKRTYTAIVTPENKVELEAIISKNS